MTIGIPICYLCKNFKPDKPDPVCRAFPEGIPEGILLGRVNHTKPVSGDHGIQYEPKPTA